MRKVPRQVREGVVVRRGTEKTVLVNVPRWAMNRTFHKLSKRRSAFLVHDGKGECQAGDRVQVIETAPISRRKRSRIWKVLERREA